MIKKSLIFFLLIFFLLPQATFGAPSLAETLSGRILLQVESYGRAWYVNPVDLERYYLKDGFTAYTIMREKSLGISDKDLSKIPTKKGQVADVKLVNRVRGRILLQVEQNGEAWYVNPVDGLRYYLKDGEAAYEMMRKFSLGISNQNLSKITMNDEQVVQDTTFDDVAYVKYQNGQFSNGYQADRILALASLTKLMTALVVLDHKPDWNRQVQITQAQIDYPKQYVGDDTTSEIDLAAGDHVTIHDLWLAMLVSSSNQSAAVLADSTSLSRAQFVAEMNAKAKALGLEKTVFFDVAGLEAHNVTTPKEMAKIAAEAFDKPEIVSAGEKTDYIISAVSSDGTVKPIKVLNRNYSLLRFNPDASKTGYLIEAQRTVALKKGNAIVVVMHALSMTQRNEVITRLLGE